MRWGQPWGLQWGIAPFAEQTLNLVQTLARMLVLPVGIVISELIESRDFRESSDGRQLTRIFVITGTDDPVQAGAFGPQLNDTYDGSVGDSGDSFTDPTLLVVSRSLVPLSVDTGAQVAIELTVEYQEGNLNVSGENAQVALDITGRTQHIEKAFNQSHFPADTKDEWDLIIGPRAKDNTLKGVDRIDTAVAYAETHFRNNLSTGYIQTLLSLHGKVNIASFRGFSEKEVLFEGVNARRQTNGQWQIDYKWSVAPFTASQKLTITDDFNVETEVNIILQGWQFLWLEPIEKQDTATKKIVRRFRSAHIAEIYEAVAFEALDIGTSPLT